MSEAVYDTTEGEFVDFDTLEEWATIDKSKDARIEELEAELAEYKHVASVIDNQWAESQDEIADLKDKLARALETLQYYAQDDDDGGWLAKSTIAELTGGKDE